jgi:hypothetical protein
VASVTAETTQSLDGLDSLSTVLPASQRWASVAVVVDDKVDDSAFALALRLAQRDGTRVILYDARASSGWTSPFPPGENIRPFLLDEPGIRRSGRDAVADAVRDLRRDGAQASAYLSSTRHAGDLKRLIATEGIDLVICSTPLKGYLVRNVHLSRREGAHLLLCPPGQLPVLHTPLQAGDAIPVEQRIQVRFLVGLFLTFLGAVLRNRSRS